MTFVSNDDQQPDDELQGQEHEESPKTPPSTPVVKPTERTPTPTPSRAMNPVPPPQAAKPARKRSGCAVAALLVTLLLVVVLVGAALLLPPFSLLEQLTGPQYVALDAETPGVSHPDGLTLTIDEAQPGEGFGVALNAVDAASFNSGAAEPDWAAPARAALPPALTLISPVYAIDSEGEVPGAIALRINTPAGAEPSDTVDLYGYDSAKNTWEFIPSQFAEGNVAIVTDLKYVPEVVGVFQSGAPAPQVVVPLDVTQTLTPEVAQSANMVLPAGLQPTMQGTLQGSLAANFQVGAGYSVALAVRNFSDPNALDTTTIETLLSTETLIAAHISQLANCAQSCYQGSAVDGIAIDYRGIDPAYRDQFSLFVRELARALHANGESLTVIVPAAEEGAVGEPWDTGAYDWRAIGRYADYVQVLLGENPVDFVQGGLVERMLRWGTGEVSRYKLQVSLSARSYRQLGGDAPTFVPISFAEAAAALGNVEVTTESEQHYFLPGTTIEARLNGSSPTTGFDQAAQTPYIDYDGSNRVWVTTRGALLYRMNQIKLFNIGGVALRDILAEGVSPEALLAVSDFALNSAAPASTDVDLALRWTVVSSSGAVVEENTTGLGDSFSWEAIEQDGNYAINVAVVGGSEESVRAGQQVAVAFPTNTPEPTATPTPTPTPTPVPAPVVQAPAASDSGAPPVVAAGRITGGFEIGGHVADFNSAVPYMQAAGMRWVKVQVRYNYGGDPGGQAGIINAAHANGFKILLGSVGYPNELANTPEGEYFQAFANFNAGLAALGADAIEVWNEMNIDREWPTGRIDPGAYTRMLQASYNAIKNANGSTMVISGALAPTGAEGFFGSDRVWNDDRYYAGMASAGAANYMDCIGAHYNEGVVAPDQVGGDPRGGFPSYFLTTMTDRAWGPFGGSRQVCYTELGYVSPEGYGPLPAGFEWGANTSVAEQAAWLASAAVINSNSGKVRLMIIWNVNFTNYEGDPMAGFAIVRPGGGCPACDTLRSVAG
ncbi:MAG: hypothetical protein JXN59_04500 [Anaerolineae bacterium]|nr:hypothetical protein [Anaerolineae bacterium]